MARWLKNMVSSLLKDKAFVKTCNALPEIAMSGLVIATKVASIKLARSTTAMVTQFSYPVSAIWSLVPHEKSLTLREESWFYCCFDKHPAIRDVSVVAPKCLSFLGCRPALI